MPRSSKAFCQIRSAGNSTLKYESTLFPYGEQEERQTVCGVETSQHSMPRARQERAAMPFAPAPSSHLVTCGLITASRVIPAKISLATSGPFAEANPSWTWSGSIKWILRFYTDTKEFLPQTVKKQQDTDYTGLQYLSLNIKHQKWKIIWEYFFNFQLGKVWFHQKTNSEAVINKTRRFIFIKMEKTSMTQS